MVFGYMVIQRLLVIVRIISRLPGPLSRAFANILDAAAKPFHRINFYGSCAAALVYNRRRMGSKLDRVIGSLQRQLAREDDADFTRGMHYPTHWDPFFEDFMTLEDLYRYPGGTSTSTLVSSRSPQHSDTRGMFSAWSVAA